MSPLQKYNVAGRETVERPEGSRNGKVQPRSLRRTRPGPPAEAYPQELGQRPHLDAGGGQLVRPRRIPTLTGVRGATYSQVSQQVS